MLENLIFEAEDLLLPFIPKNTSYVLHDISSWNSFCANFNYDYACTGLFLPSKKVAHILKNTKTFYSDFFHEYFGHGSFFEYSNLVNSSNLIANQINSVFGISDNLVDNAESFALWLEYYLCSNVDLDSVWNYKYSLLPDDSKLLFNQIKHVESVFSSKGVFFQMGFDRLYSKKDLISISKQFYGSSFDKIDAIILYGSRNPKSDIDLFIVSSDPSFHYFNGWLDIYQINAYEFQNKLSLLDISVVDPLFSGDLVFGNDVWHSGIKNSILSERINPKSVCYNFEQSKIQESYLDNFDSISREYAIASSYARTFKLHAINLSKGKLALTKKELLL